MTYSRWTRAAATTLAWQAAATTWVAPLAAAPEPRARDEADRCIEAADRGQVQRDEGKLRDARHSFLSCAREACPSVLRAECARWLGDVDTRQPTVMIVARDNAGHDLADVRVSLDGALLVERLDGKAIPVDPGEHVLTFEHAGAPPVTANALVREGDKARSVAVTFASGGGGARPPSVVGEQPAGRRRGSVPVFTWVLAGVTVVAGAGYAYFGASANADADRLRSSCAPGCATSDVDAARRELVLANVFFGVGVLALGATVWAFVTQR